jgi:hypothetical protein
LPLPSVSDDASILLTLVRVRLAVTLAAHDEDISYEDISRQYTLPRHQLPVHLLSTFVGNLPPLLITMLFF